MTSYDAPLPAYDAAMFVVTTDYLRARCFHCFRHAAILLMRDGV